MTKVEAEKHSSKIVHRKHRALVNDYGSLLLIWFLSIKEWALPDGVVSLSLVEELRHCHATGARLLSQSNARLTRRRQE